MEENQQVTFKKILEEHKVYSVGLEIEILRHFEQMMKQVRQSTIKECINISGTHDRSDDLGYCDTGSSEEYACRSECVDMATERMKKLLS